MVEWKETLTANDLQQRLIIASSSTTNPMPSKLAAFRRDIYPGGASAVSAPHWFFVLITAAIAAPPWIPWQKCRFSLRTLLIATNVIAAALAIIAAALN